MRNSVRLWAPGRIPKLCLGASGGAKLKSVFWVDCNHFEDRSMNRHCFFLISCSVDQGGPVFQHKGWGALFRKSVIPRFLDNNSDNSVPRRTNSFFLFLLLAIHLNPHMVPKAANSVSQGVRKAHTPQLLARCVHYVLIWLEIPNTHYLNLAPARFFSGNI